MRLKISTTGKLTFSGRFDPLTGEIRLGDELVIPRTSGGALPAAPGIPQNVVATAGNKFADITFDVVSGATGYNLYRDGVFFVAVGGGAGPTLTVSDEGLTNGVTYSYTVSATNTGGESAQSDPATVTPNFQFPANLVAAFEADSLSGLSDNATVASVADPFDGGNTWTAGAGTMTKRTFRGLPVLHVPLGATLVADTSFDSTFDTDLTVIVVALADAVRANQTILSDGGSISAGLAIAEGTGSRPTERVTSWFGEGGSIVVADARYCSGQAAVWIYDGAHVHSFRNNFEGPTIVKTGNLGLSHAITIGATADSFVGNVRAVYVFNRQLTQSERESVVNYACAQSSGFAGNNNYICCGDSQTGTSGGTTSYDELLRTALDDGGVQYNYLFTSANVGRVLDDYLTDGGVLYHDELGNRFSNPNTSEAETAIVWIGTNDIRSQGLTAAQALTRMAQFIADLQGMGVNRIVLLGCLPSVGDDSTLLAAVAAYNAGLAAMDDGTTIKFVAIQADARLNPQTADYYDYPSVHCNDAGKAVVAELVYPRLVPWAPEAPVNTAAPTLSQTTPSNGATISVVHGSYTGYPNTYTYRWFADGVEIMGETSSSYVVSQSNGVVITAKEIGHNLYGDSAETTTSNSATVTAFAYLVETDFEGTGAPAGWSGPADFDYATLPLAGSQSLFVTGANDATLTIPGGPLTALFLKFKFRIKTNGGATGYIFVTYNGSFGVSSNLFVDSAGKMTLDLSTYSAAGMTTGTDYFMWLDFTGTTVSAAFNTVDSKPTSGSNFISLSAAPSLLLARFLVSAGHEILVDDVQAAGSSF